MYTAELLFPPTLSANALVPFASAMDPLPERPPNANEPPLNPSWPPASSIVAEASAEGFANETVPATRRVVPLTL